MSEESRLNLHKIKDLLRLNDAQMQALRKFLKENELVIEPEKVLCTGYKGYKCILPDIFECFDCGDYCYNNYNAGGDEPMCYDCTYS